MHPGSRQMRCVSRASKAFVDEVLGPREVAKVREALGLSQRRAGELLGGGPCDEPHREAEPNAVYVSSMIDRPSHDKRKQSLYFPVEMLEEIASEARRLDRSLSWVVQRAWKTARQEIKKLPSTDP